MANHKSAIKRARQNLKRQERNASQISEVKTFVKKVKLAVTQKNIDLSKSTLSDAVVTIDKAVSKGLIHWKNGARKVSRLTTLVNGMS